MAESSGSSALPSGTYKIGFVESKTGRLAFYDIPFYQGLKLAVDQINAKGGVGGKLKLQIVTEDGKSDPAQGAIVASDLIGQKAQFGITPCDADIGIPGRGQVPGCQDPRRDGVRIGLDVPLDRRRLRLHQRLRHRCARRRAG